MRNKTREQIQQQEMALAFGLKLKHNGLPDPMKVRSINMELKKEETQ